MQTTPKSLNASPGPLQDLDDWEEVLKMRYPAAAVEGPPSVLSPSSDKKKEEFRNYEASARPCVREFYRLNHRHQTLDFVRNKKREYLALSRRTMGVWEAMEF